MRNPIELWRGEFGPWREVNQMQRLMDRLWGELPAKTATGNLPTAYAPSCEVSEDKSNYHFRFDLPGLAKNQVKIEIHDNQLTVSGERREERKEDSKRYHFSELSYGNFMRTFTLPANIDAEKVEAKFENGVLNISVSKTETAKSRQVSIK